MIVPVVMVGVPFVWLGMVVAISGLEAPLKFRAPGVTVTLGLGIGRLVFRALNVAEVVLSTVLLVIGAAAGLPGLGWGLLAGLLGILAVQMVLLRPALNRRAQALQDGAILPRSHRHRVYVGLEGIKALGLAVLGAVLVTSGWR